MVVEAFFNAVLLAAFRGRSCVLFIRVSVATSNTLVVQRRFRLEVSNYYRSFQMLLK